MEGKLTGKGLTKIFGGQTVVDDVSFEVRPGDILGFLGPNGAGKTTIIRMAKGIYAPDEGRVTYTGTVNGNIPRRHIGYLPEERGLYKDARVIDILCYLAGLKGIHGQMARCRADKWLQKFDLPDHMQSKVEELSKGMAQMVVCPETPSTASSLGPDKIVMGARHGVEGARHSLVHAEGRVRI